MLIKLCPSLIFVPSFLHFNILPLEVIPIEAMEPVKQLDSQVSQDLPVQEPPAPATATSTTPSTTDILAAYELDFLRPFRESSSRGASPTQKARADKSWDDFLQAFAAHYFELLDLDYGLQQKLRSSHQARSDFLALYVTAHTPYIMIQNRDLTRSSTSPRNDLLLKSNPLRLQLLNGKNSRLKKPCYNITRPPCCPTTTFW